MTLSPGAAALSTGNPNVPFAERSALKRAVADWCLRNASQCLRRDALADAAQWDLLAARSLDFNCNPLASPELEQQLLRIAGRLPLPSPRPVLKEARSERWLHVLTQAYPFGGHTAMVHRWIRSDPWPNRHSVVLLSQRQSVPPALTEAAQSTGGNILQLDPDAPLLTQAVQLRALAWHEADVVVLHIHPWDVVSTLAFGVSGGPPVLFLNHAAHVFWVGASVADAVLNLSVSPQEDERTRRYRGISHYMHLPIPVPLPEHTKQPGESAIAPEARQAAREALGLPGDAPILLTVGQGYKYTPVSGLDFLEVAVTILLACPDAYLFAVGVEEDARWKAGREATGGRLQAVGRRPAHKVTPYQAAADVYLGGFPLASNTALLEAGIRGIPCVLNPKTCPPPFGTEDVALAVSDQPDDPEAYVARAITLVRDPRERERVGRAQAVSIREHHSGPGWIRYLNEIQHNRPTDHRVRALSDLPAVPENLAAFWGAFSTIVRNEDPLGKAFRWAIQRGLRPQMDAELRRTVPTARLGRGVYAPSELLLHQNRGLLSHLPPEKAVHLYDLLLLLRHDGRVMRMLRTIRTKASRLVQRQHVTSHTTVGSCTSEHGVRASAGVGQSDGEILFRSHK